MPVAAILLWAAAGSARDRAAAPLADPWSQVAEMQRRMDALLAAPFPMPFPAAPAAPADEVRVERSREGATVVVRVPGLDKKTLNVDVRREGIRLSFEKRIVREDRDARGRVTGRSESYESSSTALPIPSGTDPDSARVESQGDEIRIFFRASPTGSAAGKSRRPGRTPPLPPRAGNAAAPRRRGAAAC